MQETSNSGATPALAPLRFWKHKVHLWFKLAEAQFAVKNVTDNDVKFYYVASMLGQTYARVAVAVRQDTSVDDKYGCLKRRIIEQLTQSGETDKPADVEMGARRPWEYLRYLQQETGGRVDKNLLTMLWKSGMPAELQEVLETVKMHLWKMEELAEFIDGVYLQKEKEKIFAQLMKVQQELDTREIQIRDLTRDIQAADETIRRLDERINGSSQRS